MNQYQTVQILLSGLFFPAMWIFARYLISQNEKRNLTRDEQIKTLAVEIKLLSNNRAEDIKTLYTSFVEKGTFLSSTAKTESTVKDIFEKLNKLDSLLNRYVGGQDAVKQIGSEIKTAVEAIARRSN